ncbi:hypothetical protein NFJ02_37g94760 [Pycnococcus provasolii]
MERTGPDGLATEASPGGHSAWRQKVPEVLEKRPYVLIVILPVNKKRNMGTCHTFCSDVPARPACRLRDDVESWEVDLERHPSGVVYVREDGTIDPEPVVAWSSPDIDDDAAALIHRAFSDGRTERRASCKFSTRKFRTLAARGWGDSPRKLRNDAAKSCRA